mmetsp:Transcript_18629/g.18721  ORF Transcript_18629/g.18721 Transcript_18629/m.18721 type:complete len:192 (+) Transcript_18629:233-808(+)
MAAVNADDNMRSSVDLIVQNLKLHNVNLLALDFDLTIINIHTGGRWAGTVPELCTKIRPFFRYLIPAAMNSDIFVAIVTFSPQTNAIREVLISSFPEYAEKIPIRGNDGTWEYRGKGNTEGKQSYIASVVEELERIHNIKFRRATTLLIDDDRDNIQHAIQSNTLAVHCDPKNPDRMINTLLGFGPKDGTS